MGSKIEWNPFLLKFLLSCGATHIFPLNMFPLFLQNFAKTF